MTNIKSGRELPTADKIPFISAENLADLNVCPKGFYIQSARHRTNTNFSKKGPQDEIAFTVGYRDCDNQPVRGLLTLSVTPARQAIFEALADDPTTYYGPLGLYRIKLKGGFSVWNFCAFEDLEEKRAEQKKGKPDPTPPPEITDNDIPF